MNNENTIVPTNTVILPWISQNEKIEITDVHHLILLCGNKFYNCMFVHLRTHVTFKYERHWKLHLICNVILKKCPLEYTKLIHKFVDTIDHALNIPIEMIWTNKKIIKRYIQFSWRECSIQVQEWIKDLITTRLPSQPLYIEEEEQEEFECKDFMDLRRKLLETCTNKNNTIVNNHKNTTIEYNDLSDEIKQWIGLVIQHTLCHPQVHNILQNENVYRDETHIQWTHDCHMFIGVLMYHLCLSVIEEADAKAQLKSLDTCFMIMKLLGRK